ncbi:multiple epidermal growth factor-like domains protein 8 [Protopterus annectens]|uniref:multiple epidermal growth factor-like domains protein 8 n=1 Tax=Protopterus annectens TaxID=7888 RepID=UPI001CFA790D|nr:multiple epidermal growth factor-like domains protein 8 [Protopterus annectens]
MLKLDKKCTLTGKRAAFPCTYHAIHVKGVGHHFLMIQKETHQCQCDSGYIGQKCDLSLLDNQGTANWYNVSASDPKFTPRSAAAGVFLNTTNALYIFGGFDLNTALGDLVLYNFTTNSWERKVLSPSPAPRHSHVAVEWRGNLVVYGGELANGSLANDVWLYNPLNNRWRELALSNSQSPPRLASHAAALVSDWMYIFGGRSETDTFSSSMHRFHLLTWIWEVIFPAGGKPPAAAGHSMVYHAASRSLIVYGGHRPSTARFSIRVNITDVFHVDAHFWTTLKSKQPQHGPRERAFHSATVIGNYMVVYGGNIHIHYQEEKCYDEEIFFYHLGCHQWVSSEELNVIQIRDGQDAKFVRGRYSHVAAIMNGNVLLIAGGYSGVSMGDLLAYKVPIFVFQVPVQNYLLDYCSMYTGPVICSKDPECTWCQSSCRSYQSTSNCPHSSCLGMAPLLPDCQSCLVFSNSNASVPQASGIFGWCVQNESCMLVSDESNCRVDRISDAYGWWGEKTTFIPLLEGCQKSNFLPGLHLITYQRPRNDSQPDKVSIVRTSSISLNPTTEMDVSLVYKGFIHPLVNNPAPSDTVALWARIQRLYVTAKVGRVANSMELEDVGQWTVQQGREVCPLQRSSGDRLFGNLERGNKYVIQIEGYLNNSGNGQTSELILTWNRTSVPGGSEISFLFLQPYQSNNCASYPSCLACLADQGCGWCPFSNTCLHRIDSFGEPALCNGGEMHLILWPSSCTLCEDYRDCNSCSEDPYCEWQISSNKKGDFLCSRRGRLPGAIRYPGNCPKLCNQRASCGECLSNSSQCAWCQSSQTCFFFAAYLAKYPYGECRDWYDSVHSVPQCLDCSRFNNCRDCVRNFECGWCGNTDNPTIGRCLSGDFSNLKGYSNCSVAISETLGFSVSQPALWSYSSCPDVDECRLKIANCHAFATCVNTMESFECHCNRGFAGDGVTYCNKTCYNECKQGHCSGPPSYSCICDLGWNSNLSTVNESGLECDIDCGCNFHSTCSQGPGICDRCQDWTMGDYCQLCQPGSYGNATQKGGCRQCACNGHGMPSMGYCDVATGVCYCTDNTEGEHCERCVSGFYGDPRNNGTCYSECKGRTVLTNITSSALGSQKVSGTTSLGLSYCVWVLSTSDIMKPCQLETCPTISLTIQPDINTSCTNNYVYVFDGLPEFLNNGMIQSDRNLIGAFCGSGRKEPVTVEAFSGLLVVYYEANTNESTALNGFNATYVTNICQPACEATHDCQGGKCVCRSPYTGSKCELEPCPNNCSAEKEAGVCNELLGFCVCREGYAGPDCSIFVDSGKIVWEMLQDSQLSASTASRFLQRFGHTLLEGPDFTLWMYGGMSLREGILGNVYRYSVPDHRWTQMLTSTVDGGNGPRPRYFHTAVRISSNNAMYVVGGLTDIGVSTDFWILNLTTLQWKEEKSSLLPAVAGHTLTQRRGLSLLLIGGYSPENGFNNKLLEYNIEDGSWSVRPQTGTPPTGLYGHSAVYHEGTDAVYVFGGYRFHVELVSASPELYSLHYPNLTWSLLAPSQGRKPLSHFFHVAAIFRDTMVVVGGRTEEEEFSNSILFYQINCNTWIHPNTTSDSMIGIPMNDSIAHAMAAVGNTLYISGGFSGVALGRMVTLSVPSDVCMLFTTPNACNETSSSCAWCRSTCLSVDTAEKNGCVVGKSSCFPMPRSADECRRLKTCSECLARHPKIVGITPRPLTSQCKWCTNCPEGACIGSEGSCTLENDCRINQREIFVASNCSEISCEASDCPKCTTSGKCMWTRQFKRTGETRRILSVQPTYDWTCFSHTLLNVSPMPVESSPPLPCPSPCQNYSTCSDCLSSKGADGGWQQCVWSMGLQQCMSPTYQPMRCAAGMCGHVLNGTDSCTPLCAQYQQCSTCIRQPRCGWCADSGLNGSGRCMEGGLTGPLEGSGQVCSGFMVWWAFMSCPPENECLNDHHDCNETQNCSDKLDGFECTCKNGYTLDNATGLCRPVCEQGCVTGVCVEPNRCQCHFGYVGQNCSVECQCNKHSNCIGVNAQDKCTECFNNTMGLHCEKCKPLFVGSALNGGTCKPCRDFCKGNSDICITRDEYEKAKRDPIHFPLDPLMIPHWVSEGPAEDTAVCVNCQNNSFGEKCESCLHGFFLLEGKCTKCQCNGHADTCSEIDGTGCPCQNNTETGTCQNTAQSDKKDCYKYQCAKCKDSFHGNPVNGHQCYRLISVEQEYCFDPTSQSNCFHEPNIKDLPMGRTVFFGVQPKFTNVDIRITIDVTFGGVDVYISTSYDTFVVDVNRTTGIHTVRIWDRSIDRDEGFRELPLGAKYPNVTSLPITERRIENIREMTTKGLITYLTVNHQQTILIVKNVTDRVVITYPHELHTLKSSRFYILLLGVGSSNASDSQGLLFFRQDQAHIDLFVFFSVFFSCFFLFLSVCVLLWKVKQFLDFRREQQRHIQEMTKMASRPFAKLTVFFEPENDLVFLHPRQKLLPRIKQYSQLGHEPHYAHFRRSEPFLAQLMGYSYSSFKVGPITLEPTDDGMAGVATVLFHLPGGMLAPNRACLGSALVTLRHNLQDYCSSSHGISSRKGLLSHENLTSMSL